MSLIPKNIREEAKKSIRENEKRKEQSLKQFNEWMQKHQFMKLTSWDESDSLMFIRSKKYNMDKVFGDCEKTEIFVKSHPEWFVVKDDEIDDFLSVCNRVIMLLKERDSEGRKVVIFREKLIEELGLDTDYFIKVLIIYLFSLFYDDDTQIFGIVLIHDTRDRSFEYFTKLNLTKFLTLASMIKSFPIRLIQLNLISSLTFGLPFLELLRSTLSEKFKKRFNVMTNLNDLKRIMDTSAFVSDDGEYIDCELENNDERIIRALKCYDRLEINFSKIENYENIGSFRKLEID